MKKAMLFICLLSLFACSPESTTLKFVNRGAILIPVEIVGKTYPFLFDTGSTTTIFSDKLVQELGDRAQIVDSITSLQRVGRDWQRTKRWKYKEIPVRIGEIPVDFSFQSNREEDSNIIGMDLISQLHWLFDFQDSTVILSKKAVPFQHDKLAVFELAYLTNDGAMAGAVRLNDSISKSFIFDTGLGGYEKKTSNSILSPELWVQTGVGDPNNVLAELAAMGGQTYVGTFPDGSEAMIFPALKIGDVPMDYVVGKFERHSNFENRERVGLSGYLTYGFIDGRFSYMQINPETKKLFLYSDGTESLEHTKNVRQVYERKMGELYQEHGLPSPFEKK